MPLVVMNEMFHIRAFLCSEVNVCITEKKLDSVVKAEEQSILIMNNNLCLQHEVHHV